MSTTLRTRFFRAFVGALIAMPLLLQQAGCSFLLGQDTQMVTISSSDPEAELFINGDPVGFGTYSEELTKDRTYSVRAQLPDGTSRSKTVSRTISTYGILDIVGGVFFLVPFIGVLSPGFWEFRETDVNFNFESMR
jgi:hypothetical protein